VDRDLWIVVRGS